MKDRTMWDFCGHSPMLYCSGYPRSGPRSCMPWPGAPCPPQGRVASYCSLRFSSFLPVLHGAVIPERGIEGLIYRRVLPKRLSPQLDTEAQALRDDQIAMLKPEWLLQ